MSTKIIDNYKLNDDEWECISQFMPVEINSPTGRPKISNRQVFQKLLYWLSDNIPARRCQEYLGLSYNTLAKRLDEWIEYGVFETLWRESLISYDLIIGLKLEHVLLDGSIIKSPNGGEETGRNPTDRARSGSKRSLLCDANGVSIGLVIASANTHDSKLVEQTLDACMVDLPMNSILSLDKGYRGAPVKAIVKDHDLIPFVTSHDVIGPKPSRYQIETAHASLNRFRGIKTRMIRRADRWLALLQLASMIITVKTTSRSVLAA